MTKSIRSTGRHCAEVVDEAGNVIERAVSRDGIEQMRIKHGLKREPTPLDTYEPPTGFEDEPKARGE